MTEDAKEVWNLILDMYDSYMTGDRAKANAIIAPDVTLWDTDYEPLVSSRDGLDALRDSRPKGDDVPKVTSINATDPVIDVWGDLALARHVFTVNFDRAEMQPERVRNTSMWQRREGKWLIIHNHEDKLPELPNI